MSEQIVLTDDLLRRAFAQRMAHSASPLLLERVVATAATTPQQRAPRISRRPWRRSAGEPTGGLRLAFPSRVPAFAAGVAVLVVAVLGVLAIRPPGNGPGSTPTPAPTTSPVPSPTATPVPAATPETVLLGELRAQRLRLGNDVAPIDVAVAFDSVWIADIHANDVRRFDPVTFRELARIPVAGGPAWFAEAGGALWVTTQNGVGIHRIDPATNTVVADVGDVPPCAAPVVMDDGTIWQSFCDGDVYLHIDPRANAVLDEVPAEGHRFLVRTDPSLFVLGSDGVAAFDPAGPTWETIPGTADLANADVLFGNGDALYAIVSGGVVKIDAATGERQNLFANADPQGVTFGADDKLWVTTSQRGVLQIDPVTGSELQAVLITSGADIAREDASILWVTDFNNSSLWRVEL